jgi:hypothetical protein
MNEEWSQHSQEPAEGGEGDTHAPGADLPGHAEGAVGNFSGDPAGLEHLAELAAGSAEAEKAWDAERYGGDG